MDVDLVIGKLHRFWRFVSQQANSRGEIKGITYDVIDLKVRCKGFAKTLENARWLVAINCGVRVPNYGRWFTQDTKSRLLSARRSKEYRARRKRDASVTEARPDKIRIDKIRTEEIRQHQQHHADVADPVKETLCETFAGLEQPATPEADFSRLVPQDMVPMIQDWKGSGYVGGMDLQFIGERIKRHGLDLVRRAITKHIESGQARGRLAYLDSILRGGAADQTSQQRQDDELKKLEAELNAKGIKPKERRL